MHKIFAFIQGTSRYLEVRKALGGNFTEQVSTTGTIYETTSLQNTEVGLCELFSSDSVPLLVERIHNETNTSLFLYFEESSDGVSVAFLGMNDDPLVGALSQQLKRLIIPPERVTSAGIQEFLNRRSSYDRALSFAIQTNGSTSPVIGLFTGNTGG